VRATITVSGGDGANTLEQTHAHAHKYNKCVINTTVPQSAGVCSDNSALQPHTHLHQSYSGWAPSVRLGHGEDGYAHVDAVHVAQHEGHKAQQHNRPAAPPTRQPLQELCGCVCSGVMVTESGVITMRLKYNTSMSSASRDRQTEMQHPPAVCFAPESHHHRQQRQT
jgi:hypothetical protein